MHEAHGVYAAVLTPVDAELRPDHAAMAEHCRGLLEQGAHGLGVLGTTGEANSFTVDERRAIIEHLAASGIPVERFMPGVGNCAIPDTIALTRRALAAGMTDVLMLPPFFYKAVSEDGLFDAYRAVIDGVADSRLRVYLYHIPQVSGVPIGHDLIRRLMAAYPGTITGIKDSSRDWNNTRALCAIDGLRVFCGTERLLLQTLQAGGVGCIAALVNVNAPAIRRLYDHHAGPDAANLQAAVVAGAEIIEAGGTAIPAMKAVKAAQTGHATWRNVRPPFRALDDAAAATVVRAWGRPAVVA